MIEVDRVQPGFNVLRGILYSIDEINDFSHNGRPETVTVFTCRNNYMGDGSDNDQFIETWYPGRLNSDVIGRPFEYWVSGYSVGKHRAYCMKVNMGEDKRARMYRRMTNVNEDNGFLHFPQSMTIPS